VSQYDRLTHRDSCLISQCAADMVQRTPMIVACTHYAADTLVAGQSRVDDEAERRDGIRARHRRSSNVDGRRSLKLGQL